MATTTTKAPTTTISNNTFTTDNSVQLVKKGSIGTDTIYLVYIKPFEYIYGDTVNLINNWKFKINNPPSGSDSNTLYSMTDNIYYPNIDTRLYVDIKPSLPQSSGSLYSKLTFIRN